MEISIRSLMMTALLLGSAGLSAQEVYHSQDPDLFARLSYDTSPTVQQDEIRHVCIAVSREGDYRIVRSVDPEHTQRLRGKMSEQQFQQLRTLLSRPDFRNIADNQGGLVRQTFERFGAEVVRDQGNQKLDWLNGDNENPFPSSVSQVLDWLKHFEPRHASPFERAEYPDVCPGGGLRLLRPPLAENVYP
jgi:hypothetical protein